MTRWSHHVLPSGMVVSLPMPEPEVSYGTYVSPTSFIPLKSPEEIAAEERQEAAAKALAILRDRIPQVAALPGWPCASCAFRSAQRRLLPLGFPLPPFELTEPEKPRRPWHDLYGVVPPMPYPSLSTVI